MKLAEICKLRFAIIEKSQPDSSQGNTFVCYLSFRLTTSFAENEFSDRRRDRKVFSC